MEDVRGVSLPRATRCSLAVDRDESTPCRSDLLGMRSFGQIVHEHRHVALLQGALPSLWSVLPLIVLLTGLDCRLFRDSDKPDYFNTDVEAIYWPYANHGSLHPLCQDSFYRAENEFNVNAFVLSIMT